MACIPPSAIRNIGIIAHIDAGKTTLSERILFYCQKIHRLGEVHDGAATMDFMPEEQERGITITSACTTCQWENKNINLVDTPGHVDFTIEVERCLRVLDGAVGVFCAVAGVEPQSETVWRQSEDFHIPKLAFINKMDRQGANFEATLKAMRERLGANPLPLVIPLGQGEDFCAVLDLLEEKKITFSQHDQGRTVTRENFSEPEAKLAKSWREAMLEKLAEADDQFLEQWLEGNIKTDAIYEAVARATKADKITPVYCGSALRNMGIQPLLDGICRFLPSPLEAYGNIATLPDGNTEPVFADIKKHPVALVFKVVMESGRKNCFLRLYEGSIHEGETLYNATTGKQGRIGRLYRLHADRREQLAELCAGDIAAVIGFNDAHTGDTFCARDHIVYLAPITVYEPVLTLALEPRNADEGKILDEALCRYTEEDPTLKLETDPESGLRMLSGMGELHLEVVLERLNREYKISPRSGQPQVVMRETVRGNGCASAVFDKELGKERHHGEVKISVEARERNTGNQIETGPFLPKDEAEARKLLPLVMLDAVREGVNDCLQSGVIAGWPMVDVGVTIEDVKREEGITTIPGLRMAAAQALREALANARPVTMEPVMRLEVTTPEEFLGSIISLLNQLGGKVDDLADHAGNKLVRANAPLRNLFGFSTKLRSATQGRAGFSMSFSSFAIP